MPPTGPAAPITSTSLFDPSRLTTDSIDGFCVQHPNLARLEGFPHTKVILDTRSDAERIALICGGGDGHLPAHAGFVGINALAACVSGDTFASPSTEAVIACIRALPHSRVLIIVKSYTGDKLNFGLALETLQTEKQLAMVVVTDDAALPRGTSLAGRRGVAGTILVHKLVGAEAAVNTDLAALTDFANEVNRRLVSVSCGFSDAQSSDRPRIAVGEYEIGVGIHGEEGISHQKLTTSDTVDSIVARMIKVLLSHESDRDYFWREACQDDDTNANAAVPSPETDVILVCNNLHGMIENEMNIVAHSTIQSLAAQQIRVARVLTGTFMTALHMRGFSLTLLRLPSNSAKRARWLEHFDQPTSAAAWPRASSVPPLVAPVLIPIKAKEPADGQRINSTSNGEASMPAIVVTQLLHTLQSVAESLIAHADELNALDSAAGDGDCGTTLARASQLMIDDIRQSKLQFASFAQLFERLRCYTAAMGGTAGACYSILLISAAQQCDGSSSERNASGSGRGSNSDVIRASGALRVGLERLQRYSGARPGDRTMVDAIAPALDAFDRAITAGSDTRAALIAAAEAARAGAASTRSMVARAGRASYVPRAAQRSPDAGARGIAVIVEAMACAHCTSVGTV